MGRAFSDDLRMRIAAIDEQGASSCRALAARFGVSWEYVRKIRQQRNKTGSTARPRQSRHGVESRMSETVKTCLLAEVAAQPDRTIAELRDRLAREQKVSASWSTVRRWVLKLGLRLKKSRSTPRSATRKRTVSGEQSSSQESAPRLRKS